MPDDRGDDGADAPAFAELASEARHPASHELDGMGPLEIVRLMNAEDRGVALAVEAELPCVARAVAGIVERLRRGGRLIYVGAGTSGRLAALDAAECPPTFGVASELVSACVAGGPMALESSMEDAEDRADLGAADLRHRDVRATDAVVGISASGRTPYVVGALELARERGALTIGLAGNRETSLAGLVDVIIAPEVGPELIAGSTRLKAGTAQKMVLNMLSTATMVGLEKTYAGLMVDVRVSNAKLRARATSIVAAAVDVPMADARTLLRQAGDDVRTAIVMGCMGLSVGAARARLAAHGGALRAAIAHD